MLAYKTIAVFTNESARFQGKLLHEAILHYVRGLKIGARCIVYRGTAGCYENGDVASNKIEVLSFDMPVQIQIVLPAAEADRVIQNVSAMLTDGIVSVQSLDVVCHHTRKSLLPKQLHVRDVMTRQPKTVTRDTAASETARLLLSANFHAVPVVDPEGRPIGIITQGDLIERAGMPVRLGLLDELGQPGLSTTLNALGGKWAGDIMTQPIVTVSQDQLLVEAVDTMLAKNLKRLPVVDASGRLVGMLARYDLLHAMTREAPDWKGLRARSISVRDVRWVRDVMQRDVYSVSPATTVDEILKGLSTHEVQRVAVVDAAGIFLGLVFDRDLLRAFSGEHPGFWAYLVGIFSGQGVKTVADRVRATTAADVMRRDVVTIREDAGLDEAVQLMTTHKIKRLPVLDEAGRFKGMISRDAVLRTVFTTCGPEPPW